MKGSEFIKTIRKRLRDLEGSVEGIEASAVITREGFPLVGALPNNIEEVQLAAVAATVLQLGENAASSLRKGELEQVVVESGNGHIFVRECGPSAILIASAIKTTSLGLARLRIAQCTKDIAKLLKSSGD